MLNYFNLIVFSHYNLTLHVQIPSEQVKTIWPTAVVSVYSLYRWVAWRKARGVPYMIACIDCIDFHPVKLPGTAFLFDTQSPQVIDTLWTLPLDLKPNIIPLTGDMNSTSDQIYQGTSNKALCCFIAQWFSQGHWDTAADQ